MTQFYTYLHCRPDGMPFYVGKGSGRRSRRLILQSRNPHHQNIVKKYGIENIEVLIFPSFSEDHSLEEERILIRFFGRHDIGTGCLANMTDGGEGTSGYKRTTDHNEKLLRANTGRICSEETRAKIGLCSKGRTPSPETRAKISVAKKGKKRSVESCAKQSVTMTGTKRSPEACANMSASAKSRRVGYGERSVETKEKLSKALKGKPWSVARRAAFESRN